MGQRANFCTPFYEPGARVTCQATVAITGKRFVKISGNRVSGTAVSDATDGGNYRVAPCSVSGEIAFGVSQYDAALGAKVGVITGSAIVPVTAGAAITAGQEVQTDASGQAIPLAAGKALGYAVNGQATVGSDVEIKLYT